MTRCGQWSQDNAGNWADWPRQFTVRYDATAPDNPTLVNPGCTVGDGIWQHTCGNPDFAWSMQPAYDAS